MKKQGEKTHLAVANGKENGVSLRNRAMNPPGCKQLPHMLNIAISPSQIEAFIKGYQEDPIFKQSWKEATIDESELSEGEQFYKSDEGLLIFAMQIGLLNFACQNLKCAESSKSHMNHHENLLMLAPQGYSIS
jgi:hypothetical protein